MEPMLGQVIIFAGTYAPVGWAFCQGQLLAITTNPALFALLGTNYGGDGLTTFGLPDLRGRAPVGIGAGRGLSPRQIGQQFGEEAVQLDIANLPAHNHSATVSGSTTTVNASSKGDSSNPSGNYWAAGSNGDLSYSDTSNTTMAPDAVQLDATVVIGDTGGSQPADNMQPSIGMNYIIAVEGYFPPRS